MKSLLTLLVLLGVSACSGGSGSSAGGTQTGGGQPLQSALQGAWERPGYGTALRISGGTLTRYDFTAETCVLSERNSLTSLSGVSLQDDGQTFSLQQTPLAFPERYIRRSSLPPGCGSQAGRSPRDIYDHVWHTLNDYYAFFVERDVNWQARRDVTRDRLSDTMTDADLFALLSEMLAPLDDEHVLLQTDEQTFNPARPKGFIAQLIAEFEAQNEIPELGTYFDQELSRWDNTLRRVYLDNQVSTAGDGAFTWGIIDGTVGYLRIDAMLLNLESSVVQQVEQAQPMLDTLFSDLGTTQALIVDLRLNGGGADAFALAIAQRFADAERLVVSKFTRTREGEGPVQHMSLAPLDRPSYLKPVALITSGFTTSAAEVFTLAMRAWPQVTHIGERTNGALSDVLEKPLPNGWQLELSNEVYLDAEGVSHEAVGIPVQVAVPVFGLAERMAGEDSAVNGALDVLGFLR